MKVRLIIKKVEIPFVGDESIVTYHTIDVEIPDEVFDVLKENRYTQVSIIEVEILQGEGKTIKDILEQYVKIDDICNPSSNVMQIIKQNLKGDE